MIWFLVLSLNDFVKYNTSIEHSVSTIKDIWAQQNHSTISSLLSIKEEEKSGQTQGCHTCWTAILTSKDNANLHLLFMYFFWKKNGNNCFNGYAAVK